MIGLNLRAILFFITLSSSCEKVTHKSSRHPDKQEDLKVSCLQVFAVGCSLAWNSDGTVVPQPKYCDDSTYRECSDGLEYGIFAAGESKDDLNCSCSINSKPTKSGKCQINMEGKASFAYEVASQYCGFPIAGKP